MPIKQQNRYCGVVLKQPASPPPFLDQFTKISDRIYVQSVHPLLFDGFIPDSDEFSYQDISTYNGSWSYAEIRNDQLILSRDPVGVRSLYYFEDENYFAFANEIKGLLGLPFVPFEVSKKGVHEFLFHGATDRLLENITELKAGHMMTVNVEAFSIDLSKYHQIKTKAVQDKTEDEMLKYLRDTISEVSLQVLENSNHPAAFLSGGIDSSVIAASIAINKKQHEVPFVTAISEVDGLNEDDFALDVVKHLGIQEWHQVLAQNIEKEVEELHIAMELPTTSLGSFLQYELMRFCKYKGIKDVLDGTGADALFAGHNYHFAIYWNSLLRKGQIGNYVSQLRSLPINENPLKYYIKNVLKYYYLPRMRENSRHRLAIRNNPLLLGLKPGIFNQSSEITAPPPLKNLNDFLAYEFYGGGASTLLRFNDRIGRHFGVMNHSIFSEYPEIYEFALGIAQEDKIKNGYSKHVLRNAFADLLPPKVLERKHKMGLVAPNNKWLKEHKEMFLSYFTNDLEPFFDVKKMKEMISQAIEGAGNVEDYKVFKFISFAIWYKVMKK